MRNCFKKGKMFRFRVLRGDYLILAPPPEYAISGGWALRGAPPQGALLAPYQRHDGVPGRAGDDGGGRRQLAATLGRIYPYRAAKQQAPGVAAADGKEIPGQAGDDEQVGNDEIPGQAGDDDIQPG